MRDALRRLAVYRESLDEGNRHYLDKLVTLTKEKIYSRMEKLEGLLVGPSTSESKLQFREYFLLCHHFMSD